MKLSESWLREWVNPNIDTEQLVAQLTMAGLEVDAVEAAAGAFSGVVVGEIVSVARHPDAEKLQVCQVRGHPQGEVQVVCGAPNARAGIKVPFAIVGAQLPGDFKIKKAKLRGVESLGMLCAQTELEAGDADAGLWELPEDAPVGADLRDYLQLDDNLIELDLTPNRGDCLSLRGLAREVAALNAMSVREEPVLTAAVQTDALLPVKLQAGSACPTYVGRVIKGVDANRPSPAWLQEKLRRSGVRSIDAIVDVTNYVLLELGQPLHAFDLAKLQGNLSVRMAERGEKMTLLNEQEVALTPKTLVIADGSGPIAMAGIMGGAATAVSQQTTDVFLESAFFSPTAVAGRAREYGLHTDSSHRFERGVDYQLQTTAIERATQLLQEIVGGDAGPLVVEELAGEKPLTRRVRLNKACLQSGLSLDLADERIVALLQRLGLRVVEQDDAGWLLEVPSFRFDINIEADLLEEVARVYGYDKLPTRTMAFAPDLSAQSERVTPVMSIKQHLVSRSYQEAITYSFIDPQLHDLLFPEQAAIALKNPISADMANMRTSLLPGLLGALKHNLNRQQGTVRFFEAGMTFCPKGSGVDDAVQQNVLAGLAYGQATSTGWADVKRDVDYFDVKGDLESLLVASARGKTFRFERCSDLPFLHPGRAARIFLSDRPLGFIGALHPSVSKDLGLVKPVYVFECDLALLKNAALPSFTPLSRYPEVSRDIAIVVDRAVPVARMEQAIRGAAGEALKGLFLFDLYQGEGIDPKRKSLAFSLTFQHPSRTLTDEEVNTSMASVVRCLEEEFNATLR